MGSTNNQSFQIKRAGSYIPPYDPEQIPVNIEGTDFIVDGMGNTGIGLTTPNAKLHVFVPDAYTDGLSVNFGFSKVPALFVNLYANTAVGCFGYDDHQIPYSQFTVQAAIKSETPVMWVSHNTGDPYKLDPNLVVDTKGNVGIGTASPQYNLEVDGNASSYSLSLVNGTNYAGWASQLKFMNSSNTVRHLIFDDNSGSSSATNGNLVIIPGYYSTANNTGANNTVSILGKVQIGNVPVTSPSAATLATDYSLYVEKGVIAEKYKCALSNTSDWSDYVFDKDYKLKPLSYVEKYIIENKHLPDVPSAEEVQCDGIDMALMDATLLKKIEELTLYMLELKKDNQTMKAQLSTLLK